jgi:hypothetical protein
MEDSRGARPGGPVQGQSCIDLLKLLHYTYYVTFHLLGVLIHIILSFASLRRSGLGFL